VLSEGAARSWPPLPAARTGRLGAAGSGADRAL